jgi:hypothetical protein
MDLKFTANGDMDITNGELSFVTGKEGYGQDIRMALQTWLGETVYDTTVGVPYNQVIFKSRNVNLDAVRFILQQIGERRPGIISMELTPALNSTTRELNVTGNAQTIEGEIDFTDIFAGENIVGSTP